MTRLLGLPPSIAHPPRERPLARSPATRCRLAWHRCRASRVGLPLQGLLAYFLLQKLFYVVYCRKKTLNDRQSRRVNQQSQWWHGLTRRPTAATCWRKLRLRRLQSMEGSLPPPLLQNRACHFCGTRLLSDAPSVTGIRLVVADSPDNL